MVYLDDILVFSPDLRTHRTHVRLVLSRLRDNHLYAKLDKCLFEQTSVPFLGFVITDQGLHMDPKKTGCCYALARPVGLRAIQRFIGFANFYRRLIPHFSTLVSPITALTKKGHNPKVWTPEAEEAFVRLKKAFAML